MVEVKNLIYNNKSVDDGAANYAFFDSFYGGIHLPYSEFNNLADMLMKSMSFLQCDMNENEKKCWF
jgi:hypothetical protein